MGKAIAITAKGIISVEHTEASLQRKFKKGDMVKTKCICVSMKNHERCVVFQKKFGNPLSYCNHCKFCLKVGIVEDTEENHNSIGKIYDFGKLKQIRTLNE